MIQKVLIANRGEIAVRIARACADYGVQSVAVYADPDLDALHTRVADEAYGLDGSRPADTYLHIAKLLAVAQQSGADAVHPGYGFLSENAGFAQAVVDAGLIWVGPPPAAIAALGDKVQARKIALEVGAPLVAGTPGPVQGADEVLAFAREHGLPIAIKAAYGGGGRGIKVARHMDEVADLYASAVREAIAAFGRGECFVEQFLDQPRHVEAQVIADTHGHVVVLGTRDCSLQRRNQKLVEESPAPFLTDAQRERIHQSAKDVCARAGYVSAGTVEFLLSTTGAISFLEVNTRLQVEHTVTEETAGIDLVVEQLRVADGLPLSILQTPTPRCHAFEFRINAEDVGRGFLPAPGPVRVFEAPGGIGVRVDTGVVSGSVVPGQFDSMMAKLIVTGATRTQAIARARRALKEFRIEGLPSVLPFHRAVMDHPDFTSEDSFKVHTRWIETEFNNTIPAYAGGPASLPEAEERQKLVVEVGGKRIEVSLPGGLSLGGGTGGSGGGATRKAAPKRSGAAKSGAAASGDSVTAPMQGTIVKVAVEEGQTVESGAIVVVLEAMKMEQPINAHKAGVITGLSAEKGATVANGAVLCEIKDGAEG